MRILCFGAGGLTKAFAQYVNPTSIEVLELSKAQCDVRSARGVASRIDRHRPDFIINAAGLSDMIPGVLPVDVIDTNLLGAIQVSMAAQAFGVPVLLVASTAGMQFPKQHPVYGPAKAGVIAHAAAAGAAGGQVYCLSPNRMDTQMRQDDWPDEDPMTRLDPRWDVCPVILDIVQGKYAPGANVVVRKVGTRRVDIFQAPSLDMPGLL